jgi:hypothetical protein
MERQGILDAIEAAKTRSPLHDLVEEFERANTALLRYETLTDDEKRELFDIVSSNISVRGKSSTIALRTPYREIAEMEELNECAPHRDEVRTKRIFDILKNTAEVAVRDTPWCPERSAIVSATTSPMSPSPPHTA